MKFADLLSLRQHEHGDKFNPAALAKQFIPYYESGQRIEVSFCSKDGTEYERKRGTVGVTTGWVPVFLLMLTKRSVGSSWTLDDQDKVLRVIR